MINSNLDSDKKPAPQSFITLKQSPYSQGVNNAFNKKHTRMFDIGIF
jgi:hypothetical protein